MQTTRPVGLVRLALILELADERPIAARIGKKRLDFRTERLLFEAINELAPSDVPAEYLHGLHQALEEVFADVSRRARPICSEADCNSPVQARGWCQMHYRRWYRGSANAPVA